MLINPILTGEARGSQGGTTASRNRYGQYLRARVVPVQPNTFPQAGARARFAGATERWRTLTDAERTAWESYAAATPVVNKLGQVVYLTGHAMYVQTQAMRRQVQGLSYEDAAPTTPGRRDLSVAALTIDTSDQSMSFVFDDTASWVDVDATALKVHVGRPQSAGVNYFRGPYRYHGAVLGNTGTPPTSPAALPDYDFQALSTEAHIFFFAQLVDEANKLSNLFYGQATVV